jgi:hypothetical protein
MSIKSNGDFNWANKIGSSYRDIGRSLALSSSGSLYTTGTYYGEVDFDFGSGVSMPDRVNYNEVYVAKYDLDEELGVNKTVPQIIGIYPNPTHDYFEISNSTVLNESTQISILDLQGKTVKSITDSSVNINVEDLMAGIYMVRIISNSGEMAFAKLVKN